MSEIENEIKVDSEETADQLLESVEAPASSEIQDAPPAVPVDEFDLTVGGKQIKAKRDQLIQWAQMGYDAPNKIRQLTKDIETWKTKYTEAEPLLKTYKEKYDPIDQYVRENPQFWDHVTQSWQNRNQALQDSSNPLAQMVTQLQAKLDAHDQKLSAYEQEKSQAKAMQEDQEYLKTFESVKKSYPDIDFVTPDAEGKSLEYQILEFAQQRKISDFDIAFKAFKHDDLIKRAESKAKENLIKEKQKNHKIGVLGITPAPTKRVSTDHRGKSYDDLAREAMEELGIG